MHSFDIVIVNWNSGLQLKECIESIYQAERSNCNLNKIIIVDNASSDNSLGLLTENESLIIVQNDKNLGFGKACNQGAAFSRSEFILFLNPDMLIFQDTFTNLFDYINKNDNKSIAVYGIQLVDDNGKIQQSCAKFPTILRLINRSLGLNKLNPNIFPSYTMENWNHQTTMNVDQVMGAFFMIKKEIFVTLKGFDERFFVYYEEVDLSKRVEELGCKTLFVAEAKAYHKGGGTSEKVKAKRLFYNLRSRLIYAFKHYNKVEAFFLMTFVFLVEPITRSVFLLLKGNFSEIREMFIGFKLLYKDSLNIIRQGLMK